MSNSAQITASAQADAAGDADSAVTTALSSSKLFTPITLPGGAILANRIVKAAMEEGLSTNNLPNHQLVTLYRRWAQGGAGMLISGNVMVDFTALTGPSNNVLEGNVSIDGLPVDDVPLTAAELHRQRKAFSALADSVKGTDAKLVLQISHPGRQQFKNLGQPAYAPSAIPLDMGKLSKNFAEPIALCEAQIKRLIKKFVATAQLAQELGFAGVEIHGAHGYLLSQFLSPRSNQRDDKYGGSLENRARFLLEVVMQVREATDKPFIIGVKLNSADFQRGGFTTDEAIKVVQWLEEYVDFIELSGGSYEAPAMYRATRDGSTLSREAYFLEFAEEVRKVTSVPLMVTGGIKRLSVAQKVAQGVDLVGIATALSLEPNLPKLWQAQEELQAGTKQDKAATDAQAQPQASTATRQSKASAAELAAAQAKYGDDLLVDFPAYDSKIQKMLASVVTMALVREQMHRLAKGQEAKAPKYPFWTFVKSQFASMRAARKYRAFAKSRNRLG